MDINMFGYIIIFLIIAEIFAHTDIELCLYLNNIEYKEDINLINSDSNILLKHYNNLIIECDNEYKIINSINISQYKNITNNRIIYYKHKCFNNKSCLFVYSIEYNILYLFLIKKKILSVKEYVYMNDDIYNNCINNIVIDERLFKCNNNYILNPELFLKYINDYNKKYTIYILIIIIIILLLIITLLSIYYIRKSKIKKLNIYDKIMIS
ncbi:hypothetical protein AMV160 [Betaentomopoxvirus amoorei]|uniref:AMV160 n=1 Tax=Amsacta moorei entomopoxvirus TaxID=28321 RepID=Q9EMN9_AMEPV|nr:hypothetical protein AMV160 [Amsacta moorei entomopoxvirus]AAG02866.1 AMV160 [Amsacta moorei entomopoxvirus]